MVAAPPAHNKTLLVVESLDEATDLCALVRADDLRRRRSAPCTFRCRSPTRGSAPAGSGASTGTRSSRSLDRAPRPRRGDARAGVAAAAQRVRVRHGRRAGEVPVGVDLGAGCATAASCALKFRLLSEPGVVVADVPAIAGRPTRAAEAARRARARLRRQRRVDARGQLRDDAAGRRHPRHQLRVQRGRRPPDPPRVVVRGAAAPARGRRGAVPRHRRPAARLPARPHRRRRGRPCSCSCRS